MTRLTNRRRAHWAACAIEAFRRHAAYDDECTLILDLINDLGADQAGAK